MTTYVARHSAAAFVIRAADALYACAQRLDAWLAARAKSADDNIALLAMNERELRDIGIDPARVHGGTLPRLNDWPA